LPYQWRQELKEVEINVPIPPGARGKDLSVIIQKKKLTVGLKGQEPILSGELCKEVKVEESSWTVREWLLIVSFSGSLIPSKRTKKSS
jgi:hypothetical protein